MEPAVDILLTDCVRGTGKIHEATGYLRKTINGKLDYQHRWAYIKAYGSIARGHEVHHLCENKLCVNAEHLVALTHKEHLNLHIKKRAAKYYADMTECKYGHPLDGHTARQRYCKTCNNIRNAKIRKDPSYKEWFNNYRRQWRATRRTA